MPPDWALRPAARPFARWSADTEQAFLLALRLTGRVREAAAAIGRSASVAYKRRRRDAGFAARWDAVVAEQQAAWIAEQGKAVRALAEEPLGDHRLRRDGWNDARRKLFLRALSETGSVRDACARARISSTSAYQLREKCKQFAADWEAALDTQAVTIEQAAYERAVLGWEEPIVHGGQVIGQRWRYSESLLRALVLHEQRAAGAGPRERAGAPGFRRRATREETNAVLLKGIAAAKKRLEREAATASDALRMPPSD
ncbi:hypothetical protein CVN68_19650 [Sphingomonas psychrotolerans]|uniref:Uncharacterized protein n=2 Tax=Sphingomonas psychrotolerans TaxID=1327635 RepID=A0A2K8MJ56_9SPHN|nr:hypothetical protein CVN68_19650 [Sphingomonas psychrotolerans]